MVAYFSSIRYIRSKQTCLSWNMPLVVEEEGEWEVMGEGVEEVVPSIISCIHMEATE